MSEALLEPKPPPASAEKLLCFGGHFLRLTPAMRVPFGINRGRLWVRGAANAPEWLGVYEYVKQLALRRLVRPAKMFATLARMPAFTRWRSRTLSDETERVRVRTVAAKFAQTSMPPQSEEDRQCYRESICVVRCHRFE